MLDSKLLEQWIYPKVGQDMLTKFWLYSFISSLCVAGLKISLWCQNAYISHIDCFAMDSVVIVDGWGISPIDVNSIMIFFSLWLRTYSYELPNNIQETRDSHFRSIDTILSFHLMTEWNHSLSEGHGKGEGGGLYLTCEIEYTACAMIKYQLQLL